MISFVIIALVLFSSGQSFSTSVSKVAAGDELRIVLQEARAGDTIVVSPGEYVGNLILNRRITLLGEGEPIIRGEGTGSVLTVMVDSCVISGFVIERSGGDLADEDAGILVKSNGNVIEKNEFRDVLFGVYLYEASGNVIRNNTIQGRSWMDLGQRGSGIHIWNSRDNRLLNNVIKEVRDGMYIQNANGNLIEGNEIHKLRYGVHYMYSDSNAFIGNRFYDNMAGAAIMYSRHITLRRNTFFRNRSVSSFGILFQDCQKSVADSNLIVDNAVGIFFEATGDNLFRYNTIARNDVAIQMYANSQRNVFTNNNFVDNINPLFLIGKKSTTRWSLDGRGNYWSQYKGFDFDGDGVGDAALRIQNAFDYLEGNFPRLRLYLYSPASQALEVAAKAFPFAEVSHEIDEHPLLDRTDISGDGTVFLHRNGIPFGSVIFAFSTVAGLIALVRIQQPARRKRSVV